MRALARDLGVSHTLLSLVMRGKRQVSHATCADLGRALGAETPKGKALLEIAEGLARTASRRSPVRRTLASDRDLAVPDAAIPVDPTRLTEARRRIRRFRRSLAAFLAGGAASEGPGMPLFKLDIQLVPASPETPEAATAVPPETAPEVK